MHKKTSAFPVVQTVSSCLDSPVYNAREAFNPRITTNIKQNQFSKINSKLIDLKSFHVQFHLMFDKNFIEAIPHLPHNCLCCSFVFIFLNFKNL